MRSLYFAESQALQYRGGWAEMGFPGSMVGEYMLARPSGPAILVLGSTPVAPPPGGPPSPWPPHPVALAACANRGHLY